MNLKSVTCRRHRAAFNLIEVVVAMTIMGIGVIALYSSLASGFQVVRLTREDARATQLMVELMDTLRLYNWDQITDPTFNPKRFDIYYDPVGATNGSGGGVLYSCVMRVTGGPEGTDYSDDMKTITLDIDWTSYPQTPGNGNGNANANTTKDQVHNRTFTTYVTRNGLQSYVY